MTRPLFRTLLVAIVTVITLHGLAAEPLRLVVFRLGQDGGERNIVADPGLVESLNARESLLCAPERANRVPWHEVHTYQGRQLVVVVTRFGTRLETVAMIMEGGVVSVAARRPAASTADVRRDRGQPGANQLVENAFTEIVADLASALRRHEGTSTDTPLTLEVSPWRQDGEAAVGESRLEPLMRMALEAQMLTALALDGQAARVVAGGDLQVEARPLAIRYDVVLQAGNQRLALRLVRQEDLFPVLQAAGRKVLDWHERVSDIKMHSASWEAEPLVEVTAPQIGWDGATVRLVQPGERPRTLWEKKFAYEIGALVEVDDRLYLFTDDGRMHLLSRADGSVEASHLIGRRVRGHGGMPFASHLWIGDFAGVLLAIDPASGAIAWELALEDSLGVAPARLGDATVVATAARQVALIGADGALQAEARLAASAAAVTAIEEQVALLDARGNLYFWKAGAGQPELFLETGLRASGHILVTTEMDFPLPKDEADPFDLTLTEPRTGLWIGTANGLVLAVPLPQ